MQGEALRGSWAPPGARGADGALQSHPAPGVSFSGTRGVLDAEPSLRPKCLTVARPRPLCPRRLQLTALGLDSHNSSCVFASDPEQLAVAPGAAVQFNPCAPKLRVADTRVPAARRAELTSAQWGSRYDRSPHRIRARVGKESRRKHLKNGLDSNFVFYCQLHPPPNKKYRKPSAVGGSLRPPLPPRRSLALAAQPGLPGGRALLHLQ